MHSSIRCVVTAAFLGIFSDSVLTHDVFDACHTHNLIWCSSIGCGTGRVGEIKAVLTSNVFSRQFFGMVFLKFCSIKLISKNVVWLRQHISVGTTSDHLSFSMRGQTRPSEPLSTKWRHPMLVRGASRGCWDGKFALLSYLVELPSHLVNFECIFKWRFFCMIFCEVLLEKYHSVHCCHLAS